MDEPIFIEATQDEIGTGGYSERQLILTKDSQSIYWDIAGRRVQITDLIDLEDEIERISLAEPFRKYYYIKTTKALWRFDGEWVLINSGETEGRLVHLNDGKNVQDHVDGAVSSDGAHGLRFDPVWKIFQTYNESTGEWEDTSPSSIPVGPYLGNLGDIYVDGENTYLIATRYLPPLTSEHLRGSDIHDVRVISKSGKTYIVMARVLPPLN